MTPDQKHRNAIGQLEHRNAVLTTANGQMRIDLNGQREDMAGAIAAIDRGEIRAAREVLQAGIDHRNRTREQRKKA